MKIITTIKMKPGVLLGFAWMILVLMNISTVASQVQQDHHHLLLPERIAPERDLFSVPSPLLHPPETADDDDDDDDQDREQEHNVLVEDCGSVPATLEIDPWGTITIPAAGRPLRMNGIEEGHQQQQVVVDADTNPHQESAEFSSQMGFPLTENFLHAPGQDQDVTAGLLWEDDDPENCQDDHRYQHDCEMWAQHGECGINPYFMRQACRYSCAVCARVTVEGRLRVTFGPDQDFDPADPDLLAYVVQVENYMLHLYYNETVQPLVKTCANRHATCIYWASRGECQANPRYMAHNCAAACMLCEQLDRAVRCPWDINTPAAWAPGQVDAMFERLVTDPQFAIYQPVIHSRPQEIQTDLPPVVYTTDTSVTEEDEETELQVVDVQDGPWVVTLEAFLTPEECDALIQWGHQAGYQRSSDVGTVHFDGTHDSIVSERRTSSNAWCDYACQDDPVVSAVLDRIQLVTGIPRNHSETMQLLKYEPGQKYDVHHDYIDHQRELPVGPRILTLFMYLNDVVAGGATSFPRLGNLAIQPKRGRALLWPSVLNERPLDIDQRTHHEALPVQAGIKYGANAWIHAHEYETAHERGCS